MSEITGKTKKTNHNVMMAWFFGISGTLLMFAGFFVSPLGEINGSVLGGAGELFAIVGGLMGIDHRAKTIARAETNDVRRAVGIAEKEEEE